MSIRNYNYSDDRHPNRSSTNNRPDASDIAYHLGLTTAYDSSEHGDNEAVKIMLLSSFKPEYYKYITDNEQHFLRGIFDLKGKFVNQSYNANTFVIELPAFTLWGLVEEAAPKPTRTYTNNNRKLCVEYSGVNAVDFLGWLYSTPSHIHQLTRYGRKELALSITRVVMGSEYEVVPVVKYHRLLDNALPPLKTHASDSGYDLTLVAVHKTIAVPAGDSFITLYDTGVSVEPPEGYYFDAVPRSSLFKSGYILANSIGIIDRSYRDSIKIPLMKIDPKVPDLELPFRAIQLIPRRIEHFFTDEVYGLSDTTRDKGGFGSTNA